LLQAAQESKQNFCIFKKLYQNKTKTLQIAPGFSKDKTKLFVVPKKKIRNGPEQKLLDQIFLVLIENVLFRSRILFQKLIYSIFLGTKAAKRKLSILKELWFDIATPAAEVGHDRQYCHWNSHENAQRHLTYPDQRPRHYLVLAASGASDQEVCF
jgi:hypothetical protein